MSSETVPDLVFRLKRPKIAMLIFISGKMVCTGATIEEDVYDAVVKIHNNFEEKDIICYE